MITMKLCWLVLVVVGSGFALYFGSSLAWAFVGMLLLVPLISFAANLYLRKRLQLAITAQASARKTDSGSVCVTLKNPTIFPALRVRCKIRTENQLNKAQTTVWLNTWCWAKQTQTVMLRSGSKFCGRIRIATENTILYDCFGLIDVRCKSQAATHLVVQPETFAPAITLAFHPASLEESDLYAQDRPGADLTETFQIREYVPGDSPKQIHWKLSGKFDKLIVRDPSLPVTRNVLIFWERTGESGNLYRTDAQAEVVVSLCRALLDNGIPFTVGWNDTQRDSCILHEIYDMDEFVGVMPRLLQATGKKSGVSGAALLLQTHPEALRGHTVYLAEEPQPEVAEMRNYGSVTVMMCGETPFDNAVVFDEKQYPQQLAEIVI